MNNNLKPIRGCQECLTLHRGIKWAQNDLGNLKFKFYKRPTKHIGDLMALRTDEIAERETQLEAHLVDHPPAPERPAPPPEPLRITGRSTTIVETTDLSGGEARECGDSTVQGRKYRPSKIIRTVEDGTETVRVTGRHRGV